MAVSCKYGDEPVGSGAAELVDVGVRQYSLIGSSETSCIRIMLI
jgi:hypothetical protein